ncbi:uncharacterized protein MONBRDRAFT_8680 [Monosiga brevicollis MX1]|uniref:Uncharacterized protein n=1 Tax=Monosiga brevicollis TaxID=81824 RepID=A9V0T1_MONBE|nr:uncharacterized protein MONBRDRAFT_8680 [Monosiga brevicollis MX1]EDQ88808.1 predicted protein [Monosiga brevicollis MX1]|eukprot:XP_001746421.1 hypothetical protein [Monosiga brevicollis MX1]
MREFEQGFSVSIERQAAERRNLLLQKSDVGRAKAPVSGEKILGIVHGKTQKKDSSAAEIMAGWAETAESPSSTKRAGKADVGRARVPISSSPDVDKRVHGAPSKKRSEDGGSLLKWNMSNSATTSQASSRNPLLQRAELGRPRPPQEKDILNRVHGKPSEDPKKRGGVSAAFSGWDDQSSGSPSRRSVQLGAVGQPRPPIAQGVDSIVHGRRTFAKEGGARDALSNYKPSTPVSHRRPAHDVPKDMCFGKPSPAPEPVASLLTSTYADQWVRDQLNKQQKAH